MSTSAQRTYLAKVLPWPMDGEGGFTNLVWSYEKDDKSIRWGGTAIKSIEQATRDLDYNIARSGTRDMYACQSRQAVAEQRIKDGKKLPFYDAKRSTEGATHFKSVFLDVDFKHYASEGDTVVAFRAFCSKLALQPNLIVNTGGGLHVYWTMIRSITTAEWWPMAHALVEATKQLDLKCDTQCTIDAARILRVPDTKNYKRDKPVTLVHLSDDYSVERVERALLPFKVTSAAQTHHVNGFKLDPELFPKRPVDNSIQNDLSAGIRDNTAPLAKLDEVAKECEFVNHAVQVGGADYDQPLWHLTTLLATFMEDGEAAAHAMGNKHAAYSQEDTEKFYARKVKEQKERNIGWPSCSFINGTSQTSAKFCRACPHFGKGKSPLHFRAPPKQEAPSPDPPPSAAPDDVKTTDVLPPGYKRNALGYIQHEMTNEDGTVGHVTVCETVIGNAWLQRDPWVLNFFAEKQPGKLEQISLPFEVISGFDLRKDLSRQGIAIHPHNTKPVEAFLVSWIKTLKETKDAVVSTSAFGWNDNHGKLEGFVYGSKLYTPTEIRVAQIPDAVTSKGYTPVGEVQPWVDAARLITNQHRPALDAILASAFASPLVRFTNQLGLMMSCIGDSGIGKSTAMDIAAAVWGHPVRTKNLLHDTDNSVMNKVGELRNLPIYWDDLQPDDTKKYARMVFQMSYGKERDRMNAQAKRRESGTWQTIMVSTGNDSLIDAVTQHTTTTSAGIYRIFEILVPSGKGGPGQIAKSDAARLVGKLSNNYGRVGEIYAKYLGENFVALEEEVHDYQKELDEFVNAENEERLWTSLIACVCVGAKIANRLGLTEIDEDELKHFLLTFLGKMRSELGNQSVDLNKELNVSSILSSFLNAHRARNTLITNIIPKGAGKPVGVEVKCDVSKLDAIYVRIGLDDKLIRIDSVAFRDWLKGKEINRTAVFNALKEKFSMTYVNGVIGGGTSLSVVGNTRMIEMSMQDFDDDLITP